MGSDLAQEAFLIAKTADSKADKAVEIGVRNNQKQDDHEKICAERYQGIRDDIKGLKGILYQMIAGFLALSLAISGFLLADKFF